ncbi:MAG: arylesterase [Gemmatimonadaceae bacterium]|nr:arylesterase [Gemmatimonadaceae bacterium]
MRQMLKGMSLLVAVSACGQAAQTDSRAAGETRASTDAAAPAPGSDRTILFIGTSLTAGLGLEPEQSYPALIQERINSAELSYRVVNAGVSGETSAGALGRLAWLLRQPMDIVVIETGANDGLRALSVNTMRANIDSIITRVKKAHPAARIVLVGMEAPTNLGVRYTGRFREVYPDLAEEHDVTLVPFLLDGVAAQPALNQGDGVHPNEAGARILADNVWKVLRPLLR